MPRGRSSRRPAPLLGIALLALLGTPLGAAAQAPVVAIATSACAAGTAGIQVGDTCYAAPALPPIGVQMALGGLQVLVLSRSSLAPVSNRSFATNVGSVSIDCVQQNFVVRSALQALASSSTNLVIVSSIGPPGLVPGALCGAEATGTLQQVITGLGGTAGVTGATAYSLVGIPGLGTGNGWELAPGSTGGPTALTGYLAQDVQSNYAFLPTAFVQVITRSTDGAGNPAVQVGSTTLSASALPVGAQGGYQVVLVDRHTGQPFENVTFFTNMSDPDDSTTSQEAMNTYLCCPQAPPLKRLAIVSSVGDPGALLYAPLGATLQALGGTGAAAVGAGVNYSLIGIQGASSSAAPPEASSAITAGISAQLTAIIQPDHQGLYTPAAADFLGAGAVNYGLYEILAQPRSAWPVPAPGSSGQAAAFQYLSLVAQACSIPATPPAPPISFPACAAGPQTGCATSGSNIRSRYCDASPLTAEWQSAVSGQSYQDVPHAYRGTGQGQFSEDDFGAVQNQLSGTLDPAVPGEFDYVNGVSTLLTSVQGVVTQLGAGESSSLYGALSSILGELNPPGSSTTALALLETARVLVSIGSAFAAAAAPEVKLGLGLASAAIQAGIYLVNFRSGSSAAALQAEVDDLASQLFLGQGNFFAQTTLGVAQLYNVVLTDWEKLQTVGRHVINGDAGWQWGDTTGTEIASAIAPAFQVGFYQSLLPLVSDVVFFGSVSFDNPADYSYSTQPCPRCFSTCHTPYANAPSLSYLTVSGGGSNDIYLLDQYISQTVANDLFNSPTDQSPGLGIFQPQLFQQIRGWNGLQQVLPVNWPWGLEGCFGAVMRPLPLRGQASRVGARGETALVTIDTTIAGTGPIDLSVARLSLRQVLVEADGAGELVRGPGNTALLPLELRPARGSRPNRATFRTAPGARPIVTVEVINRDVKTGKLAVSLTANQAALPQLAEGCAAGTIAVLRTRLVLDDQIHPPVAFNAEQPWRCNGSRLRTP